MKEKMEAKTLKVLMFPFLAHGHISPFLELAKKLSSRNFHIFILSTSINLDFIKDSSSYRNKDSTTIDLLELHLPPQFDERLPPKLRTTKNLPSHLQPLLMQAFQESRPSFSKVLSDLRPDLVVYDLFQPWSAKIAASEGIPAVHFFTGGSAVASILHHWHSFGSFEGFPFEEIGFREYEKKGLIGSMEKLKKVKDVEEELGFGNGVFKLSCDVVLIKSCRGIEGKYMDYLSRLCERKLVPTGPLVKDGGGGEDQENGGLEVMEWLEERERGSVLYVSFGSENFLSEKEMAAVAEGLEAAAAVGVGFVWVARAPAGEVLVVPEGFEERTKGRGVVVRGWAPQAAVLAHRSVGGFMSHCGWSSVTESLYHGVPVVALPLKIDQPANARLVVAAGAGVEVERDGGGGFDGEAVAEAVREVMVGEEREGMRRRAREMSERMKVEEEEAMDGVVEELSRLCIKK